MLPVLLFIVGTIKLLRLPKPIKYLGYMLVKNKPLWVRSRIKGSNTLIKLNIGDFIQYWIFMDGIYEANLFKFLRGRLQGKVLFDIGANIGNFPLSLADIAKHIYAFEASKVNCLSLKDNLRINRIKNVTVIHKAVAGTDHKKLKLYLSMDAQGNNSFYTRSESQSETVDTITIDTFVANEKLTKIDFIKIDVEGAELEVLRGARRTLSVIRPVLIVEFNSAIATLAGYSTGTLYNTVISFGYVGFTLQGKRLTRAMVVRPDGINEDIYFVPKQSLSKWNV